MANQSDCKQKSSSRTVIDRGRKFFLKSGAVLQKKKKKGADQTLQNRFKTNSKQFKFSAITDIFLDYVSILSHCVLGGFIPLYDIYMHMVYENVVE